MTTIFADGIFLIGQQGRHRYRPENESLPCSAFVAVLFIPRIFTISLRRLLEKVCFRRRYLPLTRVRCRDREPALALTSDV